MVSLFFHGLAFFFFNFTFFCYVIVKVIILFVVTEIIYWVIDFGVLFVFVYGMFAEIVGYFVNLEAIVLCVVRFMFLG